MAANVKMNKGDLRTATLGAEETRNRVSGSSVRADSPIMKKRHSSAVASRSPTTRHSFATEVRRRGAGIDVVQELLGHATIAMSQRYVHSVDV